jgi:hypothetical protein
VLAACKNVSHETVVRRRPPNVLEGSSRQDARIWRRRKTGGMTLPAFGSQRSLQNSEYNLLTDLRGAGYVPLVAAHWDGLSIGAPAKSP